MNIDLPHTRSSAILTALTDARHRSGTAALGMVLTFVVDVDEIGHHDALRAAVAAARAHPCRIVTVIRRAATAPPRLDAEIRVGEESSLAEVIILRLYGELRNQADSIVLPLLLPDAPVLVWWPGQSPAIPSESPLGLLSQRRVTDTAAARNPMAALKARSDDHSPGDTDLAWTRLTPWRTLLAAALDQPFDPIVGGEVGAARNNPSAELLATWLQDQLHVPVERKVTRGPGLTSVQLTTKRGNITISRPDGRLATLERTGQPDRAVALPRRSTDELLTEELRRLDPDDIYNETIRRVFGGQPTTSDVGSGPRARPSTTAKAIQSKPPMPPSKGAPESVTATPRSAAATDAPTEKPPTEKPTTEKPTTEKSSEKKVAATKQTGTKVPAKKAPAKKVPAKKVPAAKVSAKKSAPAKRGARKNGSAT